MLCSATGFFLAFSHLPLVEGYLVFFTSPFFVVALAAATLGETPRAATWLWVAVGFGGVAVGLAPGLLAGLSGPLIGYAWALFGTVAYSLVFVLNRALRHEPGIARLLFWPALAGVAVMLLPGLLHWRAPDAQGWALMIANGVIVAAATVCLAEAFRHAPVSRLAPFGYSGLVWSVCFDLLLWGHAPGWALVIGATIVVWACVMSERKTFPPPLAGEGEARTRTETRDCRHAVAAVASPTAPRRSAACRTGAGTDRLACRRSPAPTSARRRAARRRPPPTRDRVRRACASRHSRAPGWRWRNAGSRRARHRRCRRSGRCVRPRASRRRE
jgi:drug/metabolite transporter (DMT)-like permease